MMWYEALELERQVFGGDNREIAKRLLGEFAIAYMYLVEPEQAEEDGGIVTEEDIAELTDLLNRSQVELGGELPNC